MAQGSQKFKAQRPGNKKQQQSKQKGPKKGGMALISYSYEPRRLKIITITCEVFLVGQQLHHVTRL